MVKRPDRVRDTLIILIILLIACAGIIFTREQNKSAISGKLSERAGEKVLLLSWWGNDKRHDYTMQGVDHFTEENPDLMVEYRYGEWNGYEKRTKVWIRSQNEADVMQINYAWLDEYSPDGTGFYDLNKLSDIIDLSVFTDEQLEYGMKNGRLNALPIAMNSHVFYYNQDLLDKYGLKTPSTWDDLFEMEKAMKGDGIYLLGMNTKQVFLLLCAYNEQATGRVMFDENGHFTASEEDMASLLAFYKKMLDENVLCPVDVFDKSDYMAGKIAGTMCWISDTQKYCDALEDKGVKVKLAMYPELPGAKRSGWYIKPATMWAINADSPHPEEAAKLLEYLINDPYMIKLQGTEKGVPVSSKAIDVLSDEGLKDTNEYKASGEINKLSYKMNLIIPVMEKEEVIETFKDQADEYVFDRQSADECAAQLCGRLRELTK